MKEKYFKDELDGNGPGRLRVYPHASDDMPDFVLATLGYVETCCVPEAGSYLWSVRLNIAYDGALDRKKSSELSAALARCWRWIDTGEWKKAELAEELKQENNALHKLYADIDESAGVPDSLRQALALNESKLISATAKEKLFAENDRLCRRLTDAETPEEYEKAKEALALNEAVIIGSGLVGGIDGEMPAAE